MGKERRDREEREMGEHKEIKFLSVVCVGPTPSKMERKVA